MAKSLGRNISEQSLTNRKLAQLFGIKYYLHNIITSKKRNIITLFQFDTLSLEA
jgi:hypothetical protein